MQPGNLILLIEHALGKERLQDLGCPTRPLECLVQELFYQRLSDLLDMSQDPLPAPVERVIRERRGQIDHLTNLIGLQDEDMDALQKSIAERIRHDIAKDPGNAIGILFHPPFLTELHKAMDELTADLRHYLWDKEVASSLSSTPAVMEVICFYLLEEDERITSRSLLKALEWINEALGVLLKNPRCLYELYHIPPYVALPPDGLLLEDQGYHMAQICTSMYEETQSSLRMYRQDGRLPHREDLLYQRFMGLILSIRGYILLLGTLLAAFPGTMTTLYTANR